jgi:hypothetical protein
VAGLSLQPGKLRTVWADCTHQKHQEGKCWQAHSLQQHKQARQGLASLQNEPMKWGINWANDGDTMLPSDILGTHQIIEQLPNAWLRAHKINTHVHHEQSGDSKLQKQAGC